MDPNVLAVKRAQAIERMQSTGAKLAKKLKLDAQLIEGLNPTVKDAGMKELRRLESVADLLDAIAVANKISISEPEEYSPTHFVVDPVTAETAEPEVLPAADVVPQQVDAQTPPVESGDLPPAEIGSESAESEAAVIEAASELPSADVAPATEESGDSSVTAEADAVVEEQPADKPVKPKEQKASRSGRGSK